MWEQNKCHLLIKFTNVYLDVLYYVSFTNTLQCAFSLRNTNSNFVKQVCLIQLNDSPNDDLMSCKLSWTPSMMILSHRLNSLTRSVLIGSGTERNEGIILMFICKVPPPPLASEPTQIHSWHLIQLLTLSAYV